MSSVFFRFESDFVASLRCIPMAVRYKLDLSGVKLKLSEWSRLGREDRARLAELPCGHAGEIQAYREFLEGRVLARCGSPPSRLAEPPDQEWEGNTGVPQQVESQALSLGLAVPPDFWRSLSALQRYALMKLSRPGHENRNFRPALEEFGMPDPVSRGLLTGPADSPDGG